MELNPIKVILILILILFVFNCNAIMEGFETPSQDEGVDQSESPEE